MYGYRGYMHAQDWSIHNPNLDPSNSIPMHTIYMFYAGNDGRAREDQLDNTGYVT